MKRWMDIIVSMIGIALFSIIMVAVGGFDEGTRHFVCGMVAGTIIFKFAPLATRRLLGPPPGEDDESLGESDEDFTAEEELAENEEVRELWAERIAGYRVPLMREDDLLPEWRKLFLDLWDIIDPHFSEKLASSPLSEVLLNGNYTRRFSFRRFCKQVGK